jgi:hypothetical protein
MDEQIIVLVSLKQGASDVKKLHLLRDQYRQHGDKIKKGSVGSTIASIVPFGKMIKVVLLLATTPTG